MENVSMMARVAPRRGRPSPRLTEDVLRAIPKWVEDGMTRHEIAAAIGVKVTTLQTVCSSRGISLTRGGVRLEQHLGAERWAALREQAAARDLTPLQLAVMLLATVVDNDLFVAVLDDEED